MSDPSNHWAPQPCGELVRGGSGSVHRGPDPAAEILDLLAGDAVTVAPHLLGATIISCTGQGLVGIRLTEVEAYCGEQDPGSHAYRGRTPRNASMFGPAGCVYVYFTYGMHYCLNLVCGAVGEPRAVLLRAGEVVDGVELARQRRPAARKDRDLARGPARLCAALGLSRDDDGARLGPPGSRLSLVLPDEAQVPDPERIRTGPRTGVSGPGGDGVGFPWRFWIEGESSVSPYRPAAVRRRRAPGATTGQAPRGDGAGSRRETGENLPTTVRERTGKGFRA